MKENIVTSSGVYTSTVELGSIIPPTLVTNCCHIFMNFGNMMPINFGNMMQEERMKKSLTRNSPEECNASCVNNF